MSWKDNLLPASFRGVPFYVENSDYTTGRRTNQHEFPDRNEPFAEDLGKISDSFDVDGYILGDDYFEVKTQLIEAAQKEGPAELIHPYYGIKFVQCGSITFSENRTEGRIVKFRVTFREAGDNRFPRSVGDKGAILNDNTAKALALAEQDFTNKFTTDGQPGFSLDAARGWIANAQAKFNSATEDVATFADGVAQLAFSTRNLVAETQDLLQSPAKLANRLLNSLALIRGAVTKALDAFSSFKKLFGFGDDDPTPIQTTPTRKTIAQNKVTFDNYIKLTAALKGCEDAAEATFTSIEEAQAAREELLAILDAQMSTTDNDELYQALKDVSASLTGLLPDEDADLPQLQNITLSNTTDTLNFTYDLFENLDNEQDVIDRNNISHPAFVVAGTELEVIDDKRQRQA